MTGNQRLRAMLLGVFLLPVMPLMAQEESSYVFSNVAVWDGTSEALQPGMKIGVQ